MLKNIAVVRVDPTFINQSFVKSAKSPWKRYYPMVGIAASKSMFTTAVTMPAFTN